MDKKLFIAFLFLALGEFSVCQLPFKEGGMWGMKDSISGEIMIPALYKAVLSHNDSTFLLFHEPTLIYRNPYSSIDPLIINFQGDTIGVSRKSEYWMSYDQNHPGKVMTEFFHKTGQQRAEPYIYILSFDKKCVPTDYYPCPSVVEILYDSIPEYLYLIQQAEMSKTLNDPIQVKYFVEKAIEVGPDMAYPYWWAANYFKPNLVHIEFDLSGNPKKGNALGWLETAVSLEKNNSYIMKINTLRYDYHKKYNPQKSVARKIYKESKIQATEIIKQGPAIISGYEFLRPNYFELGLGSFNMNINQKSTFLRNKDSRLLMFGISALFSSTEPITGIRLFLLSYYAPFRLGVSPILFYNSAYKEKNIKLAIRPELGYSYKNATLYVGYNIFRRTEVLNKMSKTTFGIRFILPVSSDITFI